MRWIWLDRILELEPGERLVALKNVSAGEDVVHDHFPAQGGRPPRPVFPHSLVIEGMAQAAGILVGHAGGFREKVILAKIGKAVFAGPPCPPGYALRYTASLDRFDSTGAAAHGVVERLDPARPAADPVPYADVSLMFSHVDQNRAGLSFPEHNFVFTDTFMDLLRRSGIAIDTPAAPTAARP